MKFTVDTDEIKINAFNQMAEALNRQTKAGDEAAWAILLQAVDTVEAVTSLGKVAQ